jgi:hypothetical protein
VTKIMVIKGFQVFPSGTVRVLGWSAKGSVSGEVTRGEIKKFSSKSLQRLAFMVTETSVKFENILTFTFPASWSRDGQMVKKDLRKALRFLPLCFGEKIEYVWVLEFQKREAPHFHVLTTGKLTENVDFSLCCRWAEAITGASPENRDRVFFAHRDGAMQKIKETDGAKRYLLKYALKREQKQVPSSYRSVGRFWGVSKGVKDGILRPILVKGGEYELREFLNEMNNPVASFNKLPTYIFLRNHDDFTPPMDISGLSEVVERKEYDFQDVVDRLREKV